MVRMTNFSFIDLANPKSNKSIAGFTQEERDGMTDLLSLGFVDTFRELYSEKTGAYTYWTDIKNARAENVGWYATLISSCYLRNCKTDKFST